jgi:CheY-like chemotaxis protein
MTGAEVALILGLAAIIAVVALFRKPIATGRGTKLGISVSKLFRIDVTIDAAEREAAQEAISTAAREKGYSTSTSNMSQIDSLTTARLARVLWVDDNPDNNLYETAALESVGLFVTKATSTEAAKFYLDRLPPSIVITDLGRGPDPEAGRMLLAYVRSKYPQLPVIVYTTNAAAQRSHLSAEGAAAVVDDPADLMAAVQANRPRP